MRMWSVHSPLAASSQTGHAQTSVKSPLRMRCVSILLAAGERVSMVVRGM